MLISFISFKCVGSWNPLFCQIRKVKSHRKLEEAIDTDDLYTILGNDLADQAAKTITVISLMSHIFKMQQRLSSSILPTKSMS